LQSAERPLLARSAPRLERLLLIRVALPLDSFWEARGHAGSVCHALRGMMRSLLFATHVTPGRDTPAVYAVQRYCNAFFALMLQDVRMTQELSEIPSALLTESEKHELVSVRRRPLMVLGIGLGLGLGLGLGFGLGLRLGSGLGFGFGLGLGLGLGLVSPNPSQVLGWIQLTLRDISPISPLYLPRCSAGSSSRCATSRGA
jgi:hypothetical protein